MTRLYVYALFLLVVAGFLPRRAMADVALIPLDGPLLPGTEQVLLVVLHRDGVPVTESVPALAVQPGEVVASLGRIQDGIYAYRLRTPVDATGSITFNVGTGAGGLTRIVLPMGTFTASGLTVPDRVDAEAGSAKPVTILVKGASPDPSHLQVVLSEGSVRASRVVEGGVEYAIMVGAERYPRMALMGVWDDRQPGTPAAWIPIFLAGRPTIPVRTEPRARVWLQVGSRNHGPFVANDEGVAVANLYVRPGDETAAVRIEDELGNVQQTTLSLVRDPKPLIAFLAEPSRPPDHGSAPIYIAALDANGRWWNGPQPECSAVPGGRLAVVDLGRGRFRLSPPTMDAVDFIDLSVSCELPGTLARSRISLAVGEGVPRNLVLRVYPESLSADFPVAQVQVLLEDWHGQRLVPQDVKLRADRGEVVFSGIEGGALRAEYNGAQAAAMGGDRLLAQYNLPVGHGVASVLHVFHGQVSPDGNRLAVLGRALGSDGLPIPGLVLTLSAGSDSVAVPSDERGWASAELPFDAKAPIVILEAAYGNLMRRAPFLPKAPDAPTDSTAPDLLAMVEVPITAGRVREVFINAEPSVLRSGPGATAQISVRLVDRQGNPVTDESVRLQATAGELSPIKTRADGSYEAWYQPPQGMKSGTVRVTASGREGAFAASTELEVVPRPLNQALGISGGFLTNFGAMVSADFEVQMETRLPFLRQHLLARFSGGTYANAVETAYSYQSATMSQTVGVRTRMTPLALSILARQEQGIRATWVGVGIVGMPYSMQVDFGDEQPVGTIFGLAGPGVVVIGGIGARFGIGEVFVETRYLQIGIRGNDVGYIGSVGGMSPQLGYRVLF